jgi:hypothetical protein
VSSPCSGAIWETYVLGELRWAVAATGSAAQVLFFRDTPGTEIDFAVKHNGRVQLIGASWTEVPDERRMLSKIAKVAEWRGKRAAAEHWLVRRTPHPYLVDAPVHARILNGYQFTDWLG